MVTFEYDINNNCVLENWLIANNYTWENWFRKFYEYDEDNYLIHLYGEKWVNGKWVPEDEHLIVANPDGNIIGFVTKEIFLYYSPITDVRSEKNITNGFNLFQNYPNPFNSTTTINYSIPKSQFVTLKVFDMLGKEIITLVNENKNTGNYEITFDTKNLPSGIYFYQLKTGEYQQTKRMVLLR